MSKIIKLTESDLNKLIIRVIKEQDNGEEEISDNGIINWEEIFKEYGMLGYTNAKRLARWLKDNYEPPVKKESNNEI